MSKKATLERKLNATWKKTNYCMIQAYFLFQIKI